MATITTRERASKMPVWLLWTVAAIVLWGVWGAFTASAARHADPMGVVAGAVLLEAVIVSPLAIKAWQARSWALLAVGMFGLAAYACFFQGVKASHSAPVVVAMGATYPVVTYVVALLFFGEKVSWRAAVGILLAVAGTALLSSAPKSGARAEHAAHPPATTSVPAPAPRDSGR